jgi:5'/3'-nucleotidase SurE
MRIRVHVIALALVVLCSTLAAAARGPLRVLVTNDDGVKAPGIDALVRELATNPNLALTVIAPATNQSGTGDQFTTTSITVTPSSTAGAFPATAVGGFPADTVLYGVLQAMPERPDLVVSGINFGQNIGELVTLSGTIGAGLTAARLGIPAIAVSQGIAATVSYDAAAHFVGQLVERFRKSRGIRAKLTTRFGLRHALVVNVNFPTCASGSPRGVQVVPLGRATQVTGYAFTGAAGSTQTFKPNIPPVNIFGSDCQSTVGNPQTDVQAMVNGFASVTPLNADLTTSGNLRSFRFLVPR